MNKFWKNTFCALALGASAMLVAAPSMADEWPLVPGDYWNVTGIHLKDGGGYKYAQFLAGEWHKNMEFAKSKGWIKSYMILSNVNPRKGEPDLYLITSFADLPNAAVSEARNKEWAEFQKKSIEQMQSESGNRADYRTVGSDELLQELHFRK